MSEVAKNIYVTDTIVTGVLKDPRTYLEGLDGFNVRYVGGIHNLSTNDKKRWARDSRDSRGDPTPLRVIESGTGREEVWFPPEHKSPEYISLDIHGNLTSHLKFDRAQPTVVQDVRQRSLDGLSEDMMVEFSVWYHENVIHRMPDRHTGRSPAVLSSKMRVPIPDDEYIAGVTFNLFREYWRDGEWEETTISDMVLVFANQRLNKPDVQERAAEWIAENCKAGFFPFGENLFADPEEEFLFLSDICSRG